MEGELVLPHRAEFNGLPLDNWGPIVGPSHFKVPVLAGGPFAYTIELVAGTPFSLDPSVEIPWDSETPSLGRPRGYDFAVFPHEIAFIHAPEPSSAAMPLLACGLLVWRSVRRRSRP